MIPNAPIPSISLEKIDKHFNKEKERIINYEAFKALQRDHHTSLQVAIGRKAMLINTSICYCGVVPRAKKNYYNPTSHGVDSSCISLLGNLVVEKNVKDEQVSPNSGHVFWKYIKRNQQFFAYKKRMMIS